MERPKRPTAAEIMAHPGFKDVNWELTPTKSGKLPVAAGRGGPFKIDWEVHGKGETKLIWVMGLGQIKTSWQRQTLEFGHEKADQYSCLIFDNRGMGQSDKPLLRYSTSEMAKDIVELLDFLGWTAERELNVIGVSMGGMISQELAYLIPSRISSLSLFSTAPNIENTTTYFENMMTRLQMFIPKSLDRSITDASGMLFAESWLSQPDNTHLPTPDVPGVVLPPSGSYHVFPTNYHRFAAQELRKRTDPDAGFGKKGFMLQAIAAGWHYKSAEQLEELADKVGRERIAVIHGKEDRMITLPHGERLCEMLNPGRREIRDGVGHVFMIEETRWHNDLIISMAEKGKKLNSS